MNNLYSFCHLCTKNVFAKSNMLNLRQIPWPYWIDYICNICKVISWLKSRLLIIAFKPTHIGNYCCCSCSTFCPINLYFAAFAARINACRLNIINHNVRYNDGIKLFLSINLTTTCTVRIMSDFKDDKRRLLLLLNFIILQNTFFRNKGLYIINFVKWFELRFRRTTKLDVYVSRYLNCCLPKLSV